MIIVSIDLKKKILVETIVFLEFFEYSWNPVNFLIFISNVTRNFYATICPVCQIFLQKSFCTFLALQKLGELLKICNNFLGKGGNNGCMERY